MPEAVSAVSVEPRDPGRSPAARRFVEAFLRGRPTDASGLRDSVFQRVRRWTSERVVERIFKA